MTPCRSSARAATAAHPVDEEQTFFCSTRAHSTVWPALVASTVVVLVAGCHVAQLENVLGSAGDVRAPLVVEFALRLNRLSSPPPPAAVVVHLQLDTRICGRDNTLQYLHLVEHERVATAGVDQHEAAGLIAQRVSERASADTRGVQSLAFTAPYPRLVRALRNDTPEAVHQTLRRVLEGLVFCPKKLEHLSATPLAGADILRSWCVFWLPPPTTLPCGVAEPCCCLSDVLLMGER